MCPSNLQSAVDSQDNEFQQLPSVGALLQNIGDAVARPLVWFRKRGTALAETCYIPTEFCKTPQPRQFKAPGIGKQVSGSLQAAPRHSMP